MSKRVSRLRMCGVNKLCIVQYVFSISALVVWYFYKYLYVLCSY